MQNQTQPVSPSHLPPELSTWVRAGGGRAVCICGEIVTLQAFLSEPRDFASVADAIEAVRPRPWPRIASNNCVDQLGRA